MQATRFLGIAGLICVLPLAVHARQPGSQNLARKAKRLTKYFNNAQSAVVNGGVAPYAKVTNIGVQARLMVGARAGIRRATVVHNGMKTKSLGVYGGGSAGLQAGLGPECGVAKYFGSRGMNPKEVLSTGESTVHGAYLIFGNRVSKTRTGAAGFGLDFGTYTGFGQGKTGHKVIKTGKPQKTSMLRHLEEGTKLSSEVNTALQAGRANEARGKINRLNHLRSLIGAEKKDLNADRRRAAWEVGGSL